MEHIKDILLSTRVILSAVVFSLMILLPQRFRKLFYIVFSLSSRNITGAVRYVRLFVRAKFQPLSVTQCFESTVVKYPNKVCFYYEDQQWTYKQVDDMANRVANYFSKQNLRKGEAVGFYMENRPEYVCIRLGLSKPPTEFEKMHRVRLMYQIGLLPELWKDFVDIFSIPVIEELYRATEGNCNLVNIDGKIGAVGFLQIFTYKLLRMVFTRVDEETRKILTDPKTRLCIWSEPGEARELLGKFIRRSPMCGFQGYADEEAKNQNIVRDVVSSGDKYFRYAELLRMDEFGYLLKDRTGDTFRWRGENVTTMSSFSSQEKLGFNPGCPGLSQKHTGKLFLSKLGSNQLKEVKGVHFSNIDLRFYNQRGNIHPLMKTCVRNTWYLMFEITDRDKYGNVRDYKDTLLSPVKLGEIRDIDWKGILYDGRDFEKDAAMKSEVVENNYLRRFLQSSSSAYVAFASPNKQLKQLTTEIYYFCFAVYFDDVFDNDKLCEAKMSRGQLYEVRKCLVNVLLGERSVEETKLSFIFSQMRSLLKYILLLRIEMLKTLDKESFKICSEKIVEYLDAVIVKTVRKNTNEDEGGNVNFNKWENRHFEFGILPFCELQQSSYGLKMSKHRNHPLYRKFLRLVVSHFIIINDCFSHKKEVLEGETGGLVYYRETVLGWDFCKTMKFLVNEANNLILQILALEKKLIRESSSDKNLKEALFNLRYNILGHLQAYNYIDRYKHNVIFHCVLEIE